MALSKDASTANAAQVATLIAPKETTEVSMGINQHAMKFIIDRLTDLYPNPIISSVREVVSNAIDATMLLPEGERTAVEIATPSSFNPLFVVTDHGVGMSLEDVTSIYSQYGGTTKRDDFTQLGAYGLGAKAPLAYCADFHVTTTKDGVTVDFTCSRKTEGNVTTIVSVRKTGNSSGTTVKIPVRTGDTAAFADALSSYRKFQADVEVLVDGKTANTSQDYFLFDEVTLDEDSGTTGRVWALKDARASFETLVRYGSHNPSFSFVLSGWLYEAARGGYGYGYANRKPEFVVELKPGVVDFSSSRDEITKNDRYTALVKRLETKYGTLSERMFEQVMDFYRSLEVPEALRFFSMMPATVKSGASTLRLNYNSGYGTKSAVTMDGRDIPLEEFKSDSGVNLVEVLTADRPATCFGMVDMTGKDGENYRLYRATHSSANCLSHATNTSKYGRRGDVSHAIVEAVAKGDLLSIMDQIYTGNYSAALWSGKLIAVTGVDEDFAKVFTKNRLLLARHGLADSIVLFLDAAPDAATQEEVRVLYPDFEVLTTAEVLKMVEEGKKAVAKARKSTVKTEPPLMVLTLRSDQPKTPKELSSLLFNWSPVPKTVAEVVAEDAVLVMTDNNVYATALNRVLVGAVNRGADVLNKPIYVTYRRDVRAAHFELLANYENVFVSNDFTHPAKAAAAFAKTRRRDASMLTSEVEKVTDEQTLHLYLADRGCRVGKATWAFLQEACSDPTAKGTLALLAKAEAFTGSENYYGLGEEMLCARVSREEFIRLAAAVEAANASTRDAVHYSLQSRLFNAVLSDSTASTVEVAKPVLSLFAERLEEVILFAVRKAEEEEAAREAAAAAAAAAAEDTDATPASAPAA